MHRRYYACYLFNSAYVVTGTREQQYWMQSAGYIRVINPLFNLKQA